LHKKRHNHRPCVFAHPLVLGREMLYNNFRNYIDRRIEYCFRMKFAGERLIIARRRSNTFRHSIYRVEPHMDGTLERPCKRAPKGKPSKN
jgi:hypothetical protein